MKATRTVPAPPRLNFRGRATDPAAASGDAVVVGGARGVPAAPVRAASAPRQWSRRHVAAGGLVVLLGGTVTLFAVPAYSQRANVLVVARQVAAGQALVAADVAVAQVSTGPDVAAIPEADQGSVVGRYAATDLAPGTLLTDGLVTGSDGFVAGQRLVPLALKPGQLPARGLSVGQRVTVVSTTGDSESSSGPASRRLAGSIEAVVAGTSRASTATGVSVIDVRVPAALAQGLARAAATGRVTVVGHPVGE